jgi:lipoate-protein ligase A
MLEIEIGGTEDAATTFARDQLAALGCADGGAGRARIWRRGANGLVLGRFHRADPASAASALVSRRLSGGRIVPVGPGVVCITLVAPVVDWLDPRGAALRPEQVLNRALRPLLHMLRSLKVDAFYGGRDLVTVAGRTIAHVSFTVMRDGVVVVEMHVAERASFADLPQLLDRCDPHGVAGADRDSMANATSVEEIAGTTGASDEEWAARLAKSAAATFACEVAAADRADGDVTMADAGAAREFVSSPGPIAGELRTAAAVSMLGMVECAGRLRGDRLTGLEITGDLIAPFHTLDDIAAECEGEPLRPAQVRKALARAFARPRSFLLGIRELDELILRLA